jgi:hypothetical protein
VHWWGAGHTAVAMKNGIFEIVHVHVVNANCTSNCLFFTLKCVVPVKMLLYSAFTHLYPHDMCSVNYLLLPTYTHMICIV